MVRQLSAAFRQEPPEQTKRLLAGLGAVAASEDLASFIHNFQRGYGTPRALSQAIGQAAMVAQLSASVQEIAAMQSYLAQARVPSGNTELEMDRLALLGQISVAETLANPQTIASKQSMFRWFRERYAPIYIERHKATQAKIRSSLAILERNKAGAEALGRINTLAQLGKPVATRALLQFSDMSRGLKICPNGTLEKDLETAPFCRKCRFNIADEPPSLEQVSEDIKAGLAEQARRLSSEAIGRMLLSSGEERLEKLVKMARASDLTALVAQADKRMVDFLRDFLKEKQRQKS